MDMNGNAEIREPGSDGFRSVYEGVNRNRGLGAIPAIVFYPPNKGDMVIVRLTTPLTRIIGWVPGQKVDLQVSLDGTRARIVTRANQERGWSPRKAKGKGESQELHLQVKTSTKGIFIPEQKQVVTEFRVVEEGMIEFELPSEGRLSQGVEG